MNCAACQELLLDLAYGELDEARAAQAQAHLAGCAECRAELAKIRATRSMFGAGVELVEQPGPAFDARILAAAREVAASAAQRAPSGSARTSSGGSPPAKAPVRRARWSRAILASSVAAAAMLALFVSTERRVSEPLAAITASEGPARKSIQGAPAPAAEVPAAPSAPSGTALSLSGWRAQSNFVAPLPGPPVSPPADESPSGPTADTLPQQDRIATLAPMKMAAEPVPAQVAGKKFAHKAVAGPAAQTRAEVADVAPRAEESALGQPRRADDAPPAAGADRRLAQEGRLFGSGLGSAGGGAGRAGAAPEVASVEAPRPPPAPAALSAAAPQRTTQAPAVTASARPTAKAAAALPSFAALESRAESARAQQQLAAAASLFVQAASARASSDDAGRAHDLLEAIRCDVSARQLAEARSLRAQLAALQPAHPEALAEADQTLRAAESVAAPVETGLSPSSTGR